MLLDLIISGIAIGCIYALIALAFILVWKATEIVNFAQGDMLMICTFFCYFLMKTLHLPYWVSFLITMGFSMILGVFFHLILRKMIGEDEHSIIIATIAIGIIIRGFVGMAGAVDTYPFPSLFSGEPFSLCGIIINRQYVWIILITIALLVMFYYFYNHTTFGIAMRATSQDRIASQLMGISMDKVYYLSWMICSAVGAVAGMLIAPIIFMYITMGAVGIKAFPAAVLGGWGSVPGAVVGSIIIGISENLAGGYLPHGIKDMAAWILLIIVLIVKPSGIFGIHERKKV
jgi:branched-chain amino acid transport system permease protein